MSKARNSSYHSLISCKTLYDMNDSRRPDGYPNTDPDGYIDRERMDFYKEWFAYIDDERESAFLSSVYEANNLSGGVMRFGKTGNVPTVHLQNT